MKFKVKMAQRMGMKRQSKKAFTMVELLIAVMILGLAIPMILQFFISAMFLNESNRNNSIAMEHAQYVLEEIRNTQASNVAADINSGNWDWDTASIGAQGLTALSNESIDTSVSGSGLITIRVTVNWENRTGRKRSASLQTYLNTSEY